MENQVKTPTPKMKIKGRTLYKKDIKNILKLVDFDPNSEDVKFLVNAYKMGNSEYFRIRALESICTSESPSQNRKNIIHAIRYLILALKDLDQESNN